MKIIRSSPPEFVDLRGGISKILDLLPDQTPIKSVLLISSQKGAVRANHYHKKDTHYCYILSGRMEYSERPVEGGEVQSAVLEPGDMVFTPAMTIHALKALEDSEFLALATESRGQEKYEEDTVRIKLI